MIGPDLPHQETPVTRRIGLRTKMTASYVLVTATVVLLVEAVVIGVVAPKVLSQQALAARIRTTTLGLAAKLGQLPASGLTPRGPQLGQPGASAASGRAVPDGQGGILIPEVSGPCPAGAFTLAVLVTPQGRILATSAPGCYPVGRTVAELPGGTLDRVAKGSGTATVDGGTVLWAGAPIGGAAPGGPEPSESGTPSGSGKQIPTPAATALPSGAPTPGSTGSAGPSSTVEGFVYVQAPATAEGGTRALGPFIRTGLLLLLLTVVVGILFGLLSTRRLTRRLATLARTTQGVADGDLARRVPVSGTDEVAQLEGSFNRMAEQLSESLVSERRLADSNARLAERSRIARELHDSISQDLFSLSMLAGGLRKALPEDTPVRSEVAAMEETASRATREMQALLLELRPVALEGAGLTHALEDLCRAYRERLGVQVDADLEQLTIPPPVEHAVLRVAQEALANAIRHGNPQRVQVVVRGENGAVAVRVSDDGRGFVAADAVGGPGAAGTPSGMGLRSMRERVEELGGSFTVDSTPGQGTVVSVVIPRSSP
jgi:signal transduction histidine kinase